MSKYTGGPWKVLARAGNPKGVCVFADHVAIADVLHPHPLSDTVGQAANARLIAAAPDLLAACREALTELEAWEDGSADVDDPAWVVKQTLLAAIAKAENE
jgi:hypothetical protein